MLHFGMFSLKTSYIDGKKEKETKTLYIHAYDRPRFLVTDTHWVFPSRFGKYLILAK